MRVCWLSVKCFVRVCWLSVKCFVRVRSLSVKCFVRVRSLGVKCFVRVRSLGVKYFVRIEFSMGVKFSAMCFSCALCGTLCNIFGCGLCELFDGLQL